MNNDRFKFRVWDCAEERYDDGFVLDPDAVLWYAQIGVDDEISNKDQYIVEQCTGLKDANGILIYVGDIVECEGDCFEVVPSKYGFAFEDHLGWRHYKLLEREDVVIVGNLHENSELLEETKWLKN